MDIMKITIEKLEAIGFCEIKAPAPNPALKHYFLPIGHLVPFGASCRSDVDLIIEVGQSQYRAGDWLLFLRSASFSLLLCDVGDLTRIEQLYRALTGKKDIAKAIKKIRRMEKE